MIEVIEFALELIAGAFENDGALERIRRALPARRPLSGGERVLAKAIEERRNVSPATAEDMVRWLRSQPAWPSISPAIETLGSDAPETGAS